MMHRKVILFSGLLATSLSGCEAAHSGVIRQGAVSSMPSHGLVEAAIRRTVGVDSVEDLNESALPHQDSSAYVGFRYWGRGGANAAVQFAPDGGAGRVAVTHDLAEVGGVPPQAAVDATLPIMRAVEAQLESVRGLAGLSGMLVQECRNVRCP